MQEATVQYECLINENNVEWSYRLKAFSAN